MLGYTKNQINKAVVEHDKELLVEFTKDIGNHFINRLIPNITDFYREDIMQHCYEMVLKNYNREVKKEGINYKTYLAIIIKSAVIWYHHKWTVIKKY